MLSFPIGIDNFVKLREEKYYYIDKTQFIEEFFIVNPPQVSLITRPRRFGKTLLMSMLEEFFDISKNNKNIFNGLNIVKNKRICNLWQNKYPVISVTLKNIEDINFSNALDLFGNTVRSLYRKNNYILESTKINDFDKKTFLLFLNQNIPKYLLKDSLFFLTEMLEKYWEKPVIILIDEYDVPLHAAWNKNYYDEMVDFVRGLFNTTLKSNQNLKFAILTGCLRIAKESIFTGVNNLICTSISDESYSKCFGFTDDEIDKILSDANLLEKKQIIKEWYDGYCFGRMEGIYCPWDILLYVNELQRYPSSQPKAYWLNTSGNTIIEHIIINNASKVKKTIENLVNGNEIPFKIEEGITYQSLDETDDTIWSILYYAGYLTKKINKDTGQQSLAIPNKEVLKIYIQSIQKLFYKSIKKSDLTSLIHGIRNGQAQIVTSELNKCLIKTISYYDYHENFYHAFLAGIFMGSSVFDVKSNLESGFGRPDIILYDDEESLLVIIENKYLRRIEAKKAYTKKENIIQDDSQITEDMTQKKNFYTSISNRDKIHELLHLLADAALKQISEKKYSDQYQHNIKTIIHFGISFFKKECIAHAKTISYTCILSGTQQ